MSNQEVFPVAKVKSKKNGAQQIKQIKCTVVIRVGPGVNSILHALQTCYESKVTHIYVIDDAYSPSAPIYTEENTAELLVALKAARTQIRYNESLDEEEIQTDIVVPLSSDCYMVKGTFKKNIEEVHKNYKSYDIFAVAPQTSLGFSIFNPLIFALFMFDWFRALIHRFKLHQNTHTVFKVVSRKLGHPRLPRDSWFRAAPRSSYSYGGAGACLRPKKSGLSYFLYLCYSHAYIGIGSFLFLIAYSLIVGFPFYNWIPIVNHYLQTPGGIAFSEARLVVWVAHSVLSILLINKYFVPAEGDALAQFHWVAALFIPLWLSFPLFPILVIYGRWIYRGYRPPPPPPSFKFPKVIKVEADQKEVGANSSE